MSELQKKQLKQQLWDIANLLRGKVNPDDYRDYILGFIFYKYLSEKQELFANYLLEEEVITNYKELDNEEYLEAIREESLNNLGYFLEPDELFSSIVAKGSGEPIYVLNDLQQVLNHIEQSTMGEESEDEFIALFEDLDLQSTKLGRTPMVRNEIIVNILNKLSEVDFKLDELDSDVLGDAYEYLIAKFAAGAGKTAGEFYTPQQVSSIMAKIVTTGKDILKSVYDPTCGSGSLLLRIAREVKVVEFYGQELNRTTYNLARMNMILHDVHYRNFHFKQEDTLEEPQHKEMKFEAVVANPPFSTHWKGNNNPLNANDERFSQYGKLAPNTKADYAFLQHMVYQLDDNGIMACVMPHGALFREAAEGVIRKFIVKEKNYLDAVIGLPVNIFFGTSIPACIFVLRKNRKPNEGILFIDASGEENFVKEGSRNNLRDKDVDKIASTYKNRENIDKYSYLASLDEIAKNGYNLNISRYVNTYEEKAPINLTNVSQDLKRLNKEIVSNDKVIADFCTQLGIETPF